MSNSIGERIKNRRKELKLNQKDTTNHTGITQGNLSKIENNIIMPSTPALIGLSKTLKCSIDYILTGEEYEKEEIQLSEKEKTLLKYFKTLNDEEKDEIIANTKYKHERMLKSKETMSYNSEENEIIA